MTHTHTLLSDLLFFITHLKTNTLHGTVAAAQTNYVIMACYNAITAADLGDGLFKKQ